MSHHYTNRLIRETSPYLLQHAHNPVDWHPWKPETLDTAIAENKLMLISIGYAACHWCHVMEHECFEDPEVAAVMNKQYVSIKVDREERPDVDQVYMNALQLMTGQGGWPLNIVALPDGRPVWGGTYFPKDRWISALSQIQKLFLEQPEKLREYADNMEKGLHNLETVILREDDTPFSLGRAAAITDRWKQRFDHIHGGTGSAPKFMMPSNLAFLQHYTYVQPDNELKDFLNLTLTKIAYGGIYDHIGGGFSRYAVDAKWHVPHFEKMLYDNGQLVSVYANAYAVAGITTYKNIVYETLDFVRRSLTGHEGTFYASLDADSLNTNGISEEGAFYTWTHKELEAAIGEDFPVFCDYFNINSYGLWEDGKYVLIRTLPEKEIAEKHHLSESILAEKVLRWKSMLLKLRDQRALPQRDDKVLTSWNAIMLKGYTDAYKVFGEPEFLEIALKNARFLTTKQMDASGRLYRNYMNGKSTIPAYLEDYATLIGALLSLHEATLDAQWLQTAKKLTDYVFLHFFDPSSSMFFFTSDKDVPLITRSIEKSDNVIPSSNSVMAENLFLLSRHFNDKRYLETARQMLRNMMPAIEEYPSFHTNWLRVFLLHSVNFYEVAVSGKDALKKATELNRYYLPGKLLTGADKASGLPLLQNRYVTGKTLFYICKNMACNLPVTQTEEVLAELSEK